MFICESCGKKEGVDSFWFTFGALSRGNCELCNSYSVCYDWKGYKKENASNLNHGHQATGLYTQEQIDYVNNISDSELKDHLLHQIRLRDNLRADRDAFEKQAGAWPSVPKAMERIIKELSEDKSEGSYYYSWQANVAMAFKDEFQRNYDIDKGNIHQVANNAARNFLDMLCHKPEPENS
jgi:hypothetical protein